MLLHFPLKGYHSFFKIFNCISKDEEKRQLLVLINDILAGDSYHQAELINEATPEARQELQKLIKKTTDNLVRYTASQILSRLLLAYNGRETAKDVEYFLLFLHKKLTEKFPYLESVTRCLKRLLQVWVYIDTNYKKFYEAGVLCKNAV